jgi:hypothetical protein
MLRKLVVLLALANIAFFSWTQGWLDDVIGIRARGDREPERLLRQVRPESVQVLPSTTPRSQAPGSPGGGTSVADAGSLPACLEAGPFSAAQVGAAEALLQINLPSGSWTHLKTERAALWMVYMGKLDGDAMARQQEELRRLKVPYDELRPPSELAPGLSLGRFEFRNNAHNLLDQLAQRGVRNARVIEAVPASSSHVLRIDQPTPALAARIAALRGDALGKGFVPCSKP